MTGSFSDAAGNRTRNGTYRIMPAANSVYIDGPQHVMVVLVDSTSTNGANSVLISGQLVPVYNGGNQIRSEDFGAMWDSWLCNNNLPSLAREISTAMTEVTIHLAAENTTDLAYSLCAELYTAAYMGLGIVPNQDNTTYDWAHAVHGGWSLFSDDSVSPASRVVLNHWNTYITGLKNRRPPTNSRLQLQRAFLLATTPDGRSSVRIASFPISKYRHNAGLGTG